VEANAIDRSLTQKPHSSESQNRYDEVVKQPLTRDEVDYHFKDRKGLSLLFSAIVNNQHSVMKNSLLRTLWMSTQRTETASRLSPG
jgi:hypothetical protein